MSFQKMIVDGLLREVARLHPGYAPIIEFALEHEDQIEKLGPVIAAGVEEGPGAFAAAEKAAPDLAKAIRDFASSVPGTAASPAHADAAIAAHAENVTRQIVGLHKMSPEEEREWMDRTSAGSTSAG